jgi:AcrR family transcriptional regulator
MGRPRSERAHDEVLDAALTLFAERGIDATSMDAIADASGVSKATIYKHWPDKPALCLEVMRRVHCADAPPPPEPSGDLRADLIAALGQQRRVRNADVRMRLMPHLMAYATRNREFGKAWQASVFEPTRSHLRRILERGIDEGRLAADANIDLCIALLIGPMMYAHVLKRVDLEAPEGLTERVVDMFMSSYGLHVPRRPRMRRGRHRQKSAER